MRPHQETFGLGGDQQQLQGALPRRLPDSPTILLLVIGHVMVSGVCAAAWQEPLIRPANLPLWEQAQALLGDVRARTEQLRAHTNGDDTLRGKSESTRREIVQLYRTLTTVESIGDELLLRGERDGEDLRARARESAESLGNTVAELRPQLGSPQGLSNALVRRAKEQLPAIRQLDDLIQQQDWAAARSKLDNLIAAADEVGRFPEPAEAVSLYGPLSERISVVRRGSLTKRKPLVIPALREEYLGLNPDIASHRAKLAAVTDLTKERTMPQWGEQLVTRPELLARIARACEVLDTEVARSTAVLHTIGPAADTDLRLLRADYDGARVQALNLMRELILADAQTLDVPLVEAQYHSYLEVLPTYLSTLHASPEFWSLPTTALNQLIGRSPTLEEKVRRYREATGEAIRWRRRLAQRYHKKFLEQNPSAHSLDQCVSETLSSKVSTDSLDGQQTVQTTWSVDDSLESVAAQWMGLVKDTLLTIPDVWRVGTDGADPQFVSAWRNRVMVQASVPRPEWEDQVGRLRGDLLVAPGRPPLTLDAALAVYTVSQGPFAVCGRVETATGDNLTDRLWDVPGPMDVLGGLSSESLSGYPAMPALVRIGIDPAWVVHDLVAWTRSVPAAGTESAPSDAAAAAAPTGEPDSSVPLPEPSPPPSKEVPPPPLQPSGASPAPVAPAQAKPPEKKEPPKKPSSPPPGGVRF